jgi:DNA-binding NarL/FixJ family response regulator
MGTITSLTAVSGAANASSNQAQAQEQQQTQRQQQPTTTASDTVQLTESQQVYQLYNQGFQVSQIASSLSLTVAAVNSYLNISTSGD